RPTEALLHFNLAIALEDLQRLDDALASYEACLKLDGQMADAHFNAARLHEQLGHATKAIRHYSAYRRLNK
ncbi:MAG TPA: tetratricopeptide repeat protein, partial [Burkholderiaceae bacterium]|nr:tetratricopeptide repeat protein [Burkholderiaceae bacterium]